MTRDLQRLSTALGSDRFNTYLTAADGDLDAAFALYQWNIASAAAWWGPLHIYEVVLRNAIHTRLTTLAGQAEWWRSPVRVPLSTEDQKTVKKGAVRRAPLQRKVNAGPRRSGIDVGVLDRLVCQPIPPITVGYDAPRSISRMDG